MLILNKVIRVVFLVLISLGSLSACADMNGKMWGDAHPEYGKDRPKDMKYLPYVIRFDAKGNIVVLDEDGKIVKPMPVKFPIKDVTGIESASSISSVVYKGSCVQLLTLQGVSYALPLPPYMCH